jgi:single-stranded DNA-specific DHH superfamily exonuclease
LEEIGQTGVLERYGWHAQAGWLTINIDNIDKFVQLVQNYGKKILPEDLEKIIFVDTEITDKDLLQDDINKIHLLAPFWEWNKQPTFLLKDLKIQKIDLVGKTQNHLKIYAKKKDVELVLLKWSWLSYLDMIKDKESLSVIVNYEKDDYNGWFYFKVKEFLLD